LVKEKQEINPPDGNNTNSDGNSSLWVLLVVCVSILIVIALGVISGFFFIKKKGVSPENPEMKKSEEQDNSLNVISNDGLNLTPGSNEEVKL
jgi:hypothetical protein